MVFIILIVSLSEGECRMKAGEFTVLIALHVCNWEQILFSIFLGNPSEVIKLFTSIWFSPRLFDSGIRAYGVLFRSLISHMEEV